MDTLEGRHLVLAYATVLVVQGSYFAWVITHWLKLRRTEASHPTVWAKK